MTHSENMQTRYLQSVIIMLLGAMLLLPHITLSADSSNLAGLVIRYDENTVQTFCVDMGERAQITGMELLQASGETITTQGDASKGATICKIDTVGCDYPDEPCFCNQQYYWAYYHLQDNAWQYSGVGASGSVVTPGEVEGWSWNGDLPLLTMDDICASDVTPVPLPTQQATATNTATPSATPTATAKPTATQTPIASATETATATPTTTVLPTSTPTSNATATSTATAEVTATATATATITPTVTLTSTATATPASTTPTTTATTTPSVGDDQRNQRMVYLPIIVRER
jgi:hypothetical protein